MLKLSEEYLKIMEDINKHISKEEDKKYVLKKMSELSSLYMEIIDRISSVNSERMKELEAKLDKVSNTVDLIKKDIYEDEDYDFEIVCPYCNHEFVADVEDELREEIECPECHNLIKLDWDEDEECTGFCSSCENSEECHENDEDEDDDM